MKLWSIFYDRLLLFYQSTFISYFLNFFFSVAWFRNAKKIFYFYFWEFSRKSKVEIFWNYFSSSVFSTLATITSYSQVQVPQQYFAIGTNKLLSENFDLAMATTAYTHSARVLKRLPILASPSQFHCAKTISLSTLTNSCPCPVCAHIYIIIACIHMRRGARVLMRLRCRSQPRSSHRMREKQLRVLSTWNPTTKMCVRWMYAFGYWFRVAIFACGGCAMNGIFVVRTRCDVSGTANKSLGFSFGRAQNFTVLIRYEQRVRHTDFESNFKHNHASCSAHSIFLLQF